MASEGAGVSRDTLTGILGAVVLVAAMAGVFLFERGQFRTYDVDWSMQEAGSFDPMSGNLDEGNSDSHAYALTADDLPDGRALAQVRATVTWTDDGGEPDTFAVSIEGPDGVSAGPTNDDGGSVSAAAMVGQEPAATQATGRSAADARDQAAASVDPGQGLGEWTVEVTLESAPGEAGVVGGVGGTEDGSNGYSLSVAWDVWEPVVSGG